MAAVWMKGRRAFAVRGGTPAGESCRSLKAGLGPDDWKSGASFETFRAQVFNRCEHKVKCRGAAAEDDLMKLFE